ncbi:hypothetical protein EJB05_46601 [Eragrostis curvula]|uniref:non-specific serine/threonine protein kinase n=1 Tax=Eragrostis curvula TaxID=38414 RepID=A0A5J9TNM2_9POAL|nr:hypothetical protein EJB05_46601 [Eragrostis curvula]
MAKVQREILVMRLLRHHPHIVHLYEAVVSSENKAVYLVMELAEQGELFYYVTARQRLSEDEARRVFRQVAGGVSFCHRNMVVHRDLKMDNILLDSEHNVKIADFGFSKLFRYSKVLSSFCGSPDYAAPEMHDCRQYIGPEVDVWSCGVILYTMLCGCYPFHGGDDITRLQRNIRRGDFRLPPHLSDQARDLISGMLIVNPDKRMTMDKVMEHPWLLSWNNNNNNNNNALPPPLSLLPPRHHHHQKQQQAVEAAAARCGVDRNGLLDALRNGVENEATVVYHLILRTRWYNNNNLYCQHHQPGPALAAAGWSLPGVNVGDECPRQTMLHIAGAAKELGILYAHQSPTTLLCAAASSPQHQDAVFFEIQLYRPEAENKNNYVVDLKRVSGPQLDYLRICSHLASKLRQIYPSS